MLGPDLLKWADYTWGVDPQDLVATFKNSLSKQPKIRYYSYVSDVPKSINVCPSGNLKYKIVFFLVKIQELSAFLHSEALFLKGKSEDWRRVMEYRYGLAGLNKFGVL